MFTIPPLVWRVAMTLTITLTVEEEVRLRVAARKEGIDPAELVQQLVKAHLPPTPDENAASIALLQSWLAEDATDNPDDIQQAQAELDAFKQAIHAQYILSRHCGHADCSPLTPVYAYMSSYAAQPSAQHLVCNLQET